MAELIQLNLAPPPPKKTLKRTSKPMLPQYVSLSRVRISLSVLMGRFSLRKPAMVQVPRKNLSRGEGGEGRVQCSVNEWWVGR